MPARMVMQKIINAALLWIGRSYFSCRRAVTGW